MSTHVEEQTLNNASANASTTTFVLSNANTRTDEKATRVKTSPQQQPRASRHPDILKLIGVAGTLIVIFWINLSHLFGVFLHQDHYTSRAHVPVVDFDGGAFGQALLSAARSTSGSAGYPTYISLDPATTSPRQLQEDVFSGKYWTALVAYEGASDRWSAATNGTATSYSPQDVYAHYTLTARYWSFYQSNFYTTSMAVFSQATSHFASTVAGPALATARLSSATAQTALLSPAVPVEVSTAGRDFTAANKSLLNTLGTIMPVLMMFFFTMAWNGLSQGLVLSSSTSIRQHVLWRVIVSTGWSLVASLCTAGWSIAYMGPTYLLPVKNFFAFWSVTWVFCIFNMDSFEIFTTYVPIPLLTPAILTLIITSVCASLVPVEIVNPWYAVNYFFPAHHWWEVCMTILTGGGNNHLDYNLPTLAGWLVVVKIGSVFATRTRVGRVRAMAEKAAEKAQ